MHSSTPKGATVINQAHRDGRSRLAFLSAVVSLVVSFAAATALIPLYNVYRAEDGFTNFGISMAIVTYSVGTMVGLLVLGRLSNHLGRRLTAIASLGLLLLSCLLLLNVHNICILLAGRVLTGVGTGLASSTLSSYIIDAAPTRPGRLAIIATQDQRTGPGQASAACRGRGFPGHLGDRSLLPSLRACTCRRSTPHPQPD
jgi:MFS family permease